MNFLCDSSIRGLVPNHAIHFSKFYPYTYINIHSYHIVSACGCNITGSVLEYDEQKQNLIAKCKDNGQCTCLPGKNIDGDKCDRCREGFTNFPECDKCAEANKWGENCHDSK